MPSPLHRFVVVGIHDDVRLAGADERLAADSERQLGDALLVDEALAGRVGVQAAEQPIAVVLVEVVVVLREGAAAGGGRHRAALVAEDGEVAVERAARVEHHGDARAVGQGVAQREHAGVEHLHLHVLAAQEAAGCHHHVGCHDVDALVGLQALHRAVFHDDLLAARAVQKRAARRLDGRDEGGHALFAARLKVVAGAEAVAVHVRPQRHGNAQVDHAVEGVARAGEAPAQQRAAHACAREVVHVREQGVQGDGFAPPAPAASSRRQPGRRTC